MMQTIVFDTETTGLIKPDPTPLNEQPQIIEIYCCKIDEEFNLLGEFSALLDPGHPLSNTITKITGIKDSDLEGKPKFIEIYDELADFFIGTHRLVAHNIAFDEAMLKNELERIDSVTKFPWPKEHICTVEKTMGLKGYRMSLQELHQNLLEYGFEDAHRAKDDVFALVRCYHALVEKEII